MSEMTALEYLKAKIRLTKGCSIICNDCRLGIYDYECTCRELENDYPEKAIEIVKKWAKENPVKTYKNVLLEKFPNAKINSCGKPEICVQDIFGYKKNCNSGCLECWNQEYKEEQYVKR